MYVEIEDFNKVIDTVKQQAKATESQASLVRNLDELARLQHIRINSLEDQCDFLFKQMQKTHNCVPYGDTMSKRKYNNLLIVLNVFFWIVIVDTIAILYLLFS